MKHLIVDALKSGLSLEASLSVLDQMPFAILIKDHNLRFRAINLQFAAMLPRRREEIIGLTVHELYPEMAERFERRERNVLETGIEEFYQETLRNEHGIARDYFTKVTRIDGGAAGMFICISLTDVTDLNHARLRALEADKLKSEFLANMSHEIRTPLNGILGMAELLLHSGLTERQNSLAKIVSGSGVQLMRVIDDVLDFSHIEAGQMKLTMAAFDLENAVDDVVTLLSSKAVEKGLELITHFRPSTPRRLCLDEARVRQILTNLIGNAIKFTDKGHILIDVGVHAGQLRIAVIDSGHGIAEKDRARIFQKFVRSDLQDGQLRGGAGLGLTISASLVRLMKGEIGVESQPGCGSRFWFTLPNTKAEMHRPNTGAAGTIVGLVDQHELRAKATADRLRRWGYQPALLAPNEVNTDVSVAIAGPQINQAAAKIVAPNAKIILLTPLAEVDPSPTGDGSTFKVAYPICGAELLRLLDEATN